VSSDDALRGTGATAPPSPSETLARAREALEGIEHEAREPRDGMASLELGPAKLHRSLERLRDRAGFVQLTFLTVIDHFPGQPRFELVYQLLSTAHRDRLRLRARVPEEAPRVQSASDLWPGITSFEREAWDMFGIRFDGLANHKRLYLPEEYGHHPLRKDFPHEGIEPDRLYREWEKRRRDEWYGRPAQERS
jgi:NADH:ubiquinone oxidoreductase subunit C